MLFMYHIQIITSTVSNRFYKHYLTLRRNWTSKAVSQNFQLQLYASLLQG